MPKPIVFVLVLAALASFACVGTYDSALPPPTIPTPTPSPTPTQEPPVCETFWDALNDSRCPRPQPSIKRRVLNTIKLYGPRVRYREEIAALTTSPTEHSEGFQLWSKRPVGVYWRFGGYGGEAILGVTVRQPRPVVGGAYNDAYEDESLRMSQVSLEFVCRNGSIHAEFRYWNPFPHPFKKPKPTWTLEWSAGGDHEARREAHVEGTSGGLKAVIADARDMWEAARESNKLALRVDYPNGGINSMARGAWGFHSAWRKAEKAIPFIEHCGEY